ncbi:putative helicase [uncultured virus]|uniref:Putative helicase n=1 Tax=uncultured virus TaxID=340016 RepID=A0A218MKL4_9VIRU|nr:putative helicase [uncultured virus]
MINYKFKTKPYEHQLKALDKSVDKKEYGYFMEMGTGKSKVLIDNMSMLYDKGKINGALIIAPKGVYNNWYSQEIPNHLASHIQPKMVLWTASTSKAKDKEYQLLFATGYDLHILVMNVEAFSTDKGRLFAGKFLRAHRTLMAIDESTTIKNPTAKRTKAIVALGKEAYYKRILTGSPVTKSPLDLFSQCQFLNDSLIESGSYYSFKNRYAVMKTHNFGGRRVQLVHSYQRLDELASILKKFSYRVLKEDCLDLPDKIYIKREVELSKEQKEAYSTMKSAALAAVKGKLATAPHVLTQMMRLHQITCGHLKNDDDSISELKNNRMDSLLELLEEVEGKVIIWANYVHDVEKIVATLCKEYGPETVVQYYGATAQPQRQKAIKDFQDSNSKVKYFVGNPQTAGYGITLTEAGTVVYFSNGYDLEKRLQSEDRAHRIGQKKSVTYVDLIAPKTVDEKIVKALRNKIDIASQVMGEDLKEWI